ncbi:MAG TPA: DUF2231 domain-containing protein [Caldimonas sp.]|jgi:uncharacterized membrane protein|nr:DUF2231 domain-containing protein [Caldimonas sp.]
MESRVKLFGHPVHQMLIVFPLGLLATSVVFDIIHLASGAAYAATVAYALIASGIVGGLLAAPFGLIDWIAIPSGTRAKKIGGWHGSGNVVVLVLFALSLWLRSGQVAQPPTWAWLLSFCGAAIALVTGWLGGELVDRLGIGISANAHPDAPSSLHDSADDHRPAHPRSA